MNPEELEGRLTTVYEKVLTTTVDNIQHIESTTVNGLVVVKLFLQPGASIDRANAQVTAGELPVILVGVPSQLLEKPPDIAANERRVAEANQQIGIARAAYFPTLVWSAAGGFEGTSITNWLTWPSRFWAAGPTGDSVRRRTAPREFRGCGCEL